MSDAERVVRAALARLAPTYPALPTCLVVDDRQPSFGVATFSDLDDDGCAHFAFKDGEVSEKNACHELGHALHRIARDGKRRLGGEPYETDDPVYVAFWDAMGYDSSLADAASLWRSISLAGDAGSAWSHKPAEHFAEAFGSLITGQVRSGLFEKYGGSFIEARPRLETFFRSLRPYTAVSGGDTGLAQRIAAFWARPDVPEWFREWAGNFEAQYGEKLRRLA